MVNNPSSSGYRIDVAGSSQVDMSQENPFNGFDLLTRERSWVNPSQDNPPNGYDLFLRRSSRLNTSQDMSQQSEYNGFDWSTPLD